MRQENHTSIELQVDEHVLTAVLETLSESHFCARKLKIEGDFRYATIFNAAIEEQFRENPLLKVVELIASVIPYFQTFTTNNKILLSAAGNRGKGTWF
jgi:hypothetical protein